MNVIKKMLKSCDLTYSFCKWLIKKYNLVKKSCKERFFAKQSLTVIGDLQEMMEETGNIFYFAFGTLLGIIRDGKLLKHDMDIDMILYCKDQEDIERCKSLFLKSGMIAEYEFTVENIGITQHAFLYKKIRVDVHYCFSKEHDCKDYVYVLFDDDTDANRVARFACPHCVQVSRHNFRNVWINVPDNPIGFIENMYGEKWRVPDKNYKYWESACVDVLEEHGMCVECRSVK